MGETYNVRFEPVGIDIEVNEDETVLNAAFRQGVMLMHGCKEGQCSACKSFLLDGDVDLDRYSTFALPDFEEAEGWTLLCRAHPMTDLEVELINYDEEILRNGLPLQTVQTRVAAVEELTHDIRRLVLTLESPKELVFHPGQYIDVGIPGKEDEHRSFSMANLPSDAGRVELMIKLYPDGHFSGLLADGTIGEGQELAITGPYGTFTLRESSQRPLVMIGGGAGMAPMLALLRQMEAEENARPATFYYGARGSADLFALEELERLTKALSGFEFVPALSDDDPGEDWTGESGLITDVVERRETDLADADAYVCGPPPMVEAAMDLLKAKGVPDSRIFYDKFTTTATPEETSAT
ncbi:MAG: 2Fe-2S iron-sulfur cluster binding domain-containing protein [Solirubrobacterales bacterium]|nr:2Fe-2S iron-sulfur cluster binding domain-containing protein [Solirubrobacterales bacterium]